jgi:hypothetical protein
MNIFVGSLPFSIEEADLRVFRGLQTVDSVKIISDLQEEVVLVLLRCQTMTKLKSN